MVDRYQSAENNTIVTSFEKVSSTVTQLNPLNQAESNVTKYVTCLSSVQRNDEVVGVPDDIIYIGFDFNKVWRNSDEVNCDVTIIFFLLKVNNPKYHDLDLYPLNQVPISKHLYTPQINNVSWKSPSSPILTQPNDVDDSQLCNTHIENDVTNQTVSSRLRFVTSSTSRRFHFLVSSL